MGFMAVQIRRRVTHAFSYWVAAARALAALETRHQLQADDMRKKRRVALLATVAQAWGEETARAKQESQRARSAKVLRCWQLYTQEQVLLRKYLNQCSTTNLTGFHGALNGSAMPDPVHPADFERLYVQMAALRWD